MIKKGYQLRVTSWENDADNYNTVSLDGLSKEDVEFYLNFIKVFRELDLENRCDEPITDEEAASFREKISDLYNGNIPEKFKEWLGSDGYAIVELSSDVLSGSTDFTTRVYDSHEVYFFPEDVNEVTDQFDIISSRY